MDKKDRTKRDDEYGSLLRWEASLAIALRCNYGISSGGGKYIYVSFVAQRYVSVTKALLCTIFGIYFNSSLSILLSFYHSVLHSSDVSMGSMADGVSL